MSIPSCTQEVKCDKVRADIAKGMRMGSEPPLFGLELTEACDHLFLGFLLGCNGATNTYHIIEFEARDLSPLAPESSQSERHPVIKLARIPDRIWQRQTY